MHVTIMFINKTVISVICYCGKLKYKQKQVVKLENEQN